ncbi:MAG TPA: hypothetical protein VN931_03440, partial [Fibrobacteria bacterium]|nr:hypothetical protein [Fibrobacteria bacterium]
MGSAARFPDRGVRAPGDIFPASIAIGSPTPSSAGPASAHIDPKEERMASKYVYFFGANASEGNGTQKNLLGGK